MGGAEQLIEAAVAHLQRRDGAAAAPLLRQAAQAGANPPPWLLLAQACRLSVDEAGEGEALRHALAIEPGNLRALLMRADWYARAGDNGQAQSFYRAALGRAQPGQRLAPDLIDHLRRAERWVAERTRAFEAAIDSALAAAGQPRGQVGPRVAESLDILAGRAEPQVQSPKSFYFPGLPQIAFYPREAFPWLEALEAAAPAIRAELAAAEDAAFSPYVVAPGHRADARHKLLNDPAWSALHLTDRGLPVPGVADRFHAVFAALDGLPLPRIRGRSPSVMFSQLLPGAHIPPHHGLLNTRLIVHLALDAPPGCALKVGNHTRAFETGRAHVFDDSILHEAWNRSNRPRTILLFEIWRPELTADERAALTAIFEAAEASGASLPRDG